MLPNFAQKRILVIMIAESSLKMEYVADIFSAISDDKSLLLFKTIAVSNSGSTGMLLTRFNLTRKQYYSRISGLVKANLVNRRDRKYFLTTFGKIVYETQTIIEAALRNYWKLKAIDGLNSDSDPMPKEEYDKVIDALIDNDRIKKGLRINSRIPLELV
jgi:hypothetical protein